jgi:hypothetical protein
VKTLHNVKSGVGFEVKGREGITDYEEKFGNIKSLIESNPTSVFFGSYNYWLNLYCMIQFNCNNDIK